MTTPPSDESILRVGFVPGVTLTKWTTTWRERFRSVRLEPVEVAEAEQRQVLDERTVDLCFVRLPLRTDGLHLIHLYQEAPVVWVSKEHPIAAYDEVGLADLGDENVLTRADPSSINQVALEVAVLLVPMSIARSHSRRDLTYRPVSDGTPTTIGLAWPAEHPHPLTDEFIGVVRGRTANSSRTQSERSARRAGTTTRAASTRSGSRARRRR